MKCPFDLKNKKQVIRFEEIDPYNPQNTVKGYVNRRQGNMYGDLYITHVNGKKCYQHIYSAPKQHYPFDKDNNWKFPEYDCIELYEKLDGTCIIHYNYHNGKEWFTTFKTRLRPFLGKSKFGNFFELWNEMLVKYPNIKKLCEESIDYSYIFELYGKRNKILIEYDVPLDTKCIFVRNQSNGDIMSPNSLSFFLECKPPILYTNNIIDMVNDKMYTEIQNQLEVELDIDEENKILRGKEGYVMYFIKDDCTVQIKNKPPSVLKYHWSGDAVAYESIYTTVINAFENFDEPTYDDVVSLLIEEFDLSKIEKSRVRIEKVLGKVLFDKKYQYKLAKDYKKHNFDINKDKVTCMRWFGKNYPKSEAKRIFNLLKQYEEK